MASDFENGVKSCIRSLLTSTPLVLTVRKLQNDYKNTIGEDIPVQRMGYSNLEHFLKSIPDTCSVNGYGPNASVLPIVSEKTAHINEMVTRQKVTIKGPMKRYMMARPKNTPIRKMQYPSQMPYKQPPTPVEPPKKPPPLLHTIIGAPVRYENGVAPSPNVNINKPVVKCEPKPEISIPYKSTVDKSSVSVVKDKDTRSSKVLKNTSSKHVNVPECMQNELKEIISKFPDGIWCSDLPTYYRKRYNRKLDYEIYGYRRLIDLCMDLSGIFHCHQPGMCDYRLYDKTKPLPLEARKDNNLFDEISEVEESIAHLDWLDCSPLIPSDVCKVGHIISKGFVPENTKENEQIRVVVVEIYDPSKFWIYLYNSPLDRMMNEMQVFYQAQKDEYLIPEFLLVDGLYCVQVIYNEYHRALIVDTMPDVKGQVKLLYIDYGTLTKAPSQGICFLHRKFAQIPWQQIRCRLANVVPVEDMGPWPQEARQRFCQLIKGRDLEAKISSIDWKEKIIEIFLADVTDQKIFYINDVLVDEGFALTSDKERLPRKLKLTAQPIVKNLHLFPTFDELEYGLAPNGAQMSGFHECEVPLNFCMPQYFKTSAEEKGVAQRHARLLESAGVDGFSTPILHDYDIDVVRSVSADFDAFGDYGESVRKELEELGYFLEEWEEEEEEDNVVENVIDSNYALSTKLLEDLDLSDATEYASDNDDFLLKTSNLDFDSINLDTIKEFIPNGVEKKTNPFLNLNLDLPEDYNDFGVHNPSEEKKKKNTNPFLPSDPSTSSSSSSSSSSDGETCSATVETVSLIRGNGAIRYEGFESTSSTGSPKRNSTSGESLVEVEEVKRSPPVVLPPPETITTGGFRNAVCGYQPRPQHFMPAASVVYNSVQQYTFMDPYMQRPAPGFPPANNMMMPPQSGYGMPPLGSGYFPFCPPRPQFPPQMPRHPPMPPPGFPPLANNNPFPAWSNIDMLSDDREDFYTRYNQQILQKQAANKN
ncbi:unnamed protein product [Brassicogethes aeneus]|uniref:HTH OST-type domain-containing protein n=1 Tax=Brassicogethes aeneus TaxID=1431903 RepID=A0A9P0FF62_BRAAE|nr:unnamed protein product [Brassicogethes aeneus]